MTAITVGVPVYNGAQFLEECLACLERQTFRNFEVLICDNASEDSTPDIAGRFVRRDSRFRYIRHSENVGAIGNFTACLDTATTPYFLWRAHDDLTVENFLDVTYRLLVSRPDAKLAVGAVESINLDKSGRRSIHPMPHISGPRLWQIGQLLFRAHTSWFYGLWERTALKNIYHAVLDAYPHAWAHDHLVLYPLLLDCAVVGSNETRFVQRIVRKSPAPAGIAKRTPSHKIKRLHRRWEFHAYCQSVLNQRSFTPSKRLMLELMTWHYVGMRTISASRALSYRILLNQKERQCLGETA